MADPARVQGNRRAAIAFFIEDSRGDLVDIEFVCTWHTRADDAIGALPWPAYEFSPDYVTACAECHKPIHVPNGLEQTETERLRRAIFGD